MDYQHQFSSLRVHFEFKQIILVILLPDLSLAAHGSLGLKVGPGPEHDVEMLRAAAGDTVTLHHAPCAALTPPPDNTNGEKELV